MITIFLCDDSGKSIEKYSNLIKKMSEKHQIDISLSVFYSGESLLFTLYDDPNLPDIIYLDVLMEKLNGIDTARELRKLGCSAEIIFLTTSEDYVFDSFDTDPAHYLLKDKTPASRFEHVFLCAVQATDKETTKKFVCKAGAARKIIPLKDISHFSIWKGIVTIHYGNNETFEYWITMEDLQKQLQGRDFVRTHRSYIVHLPYITLLQNQKLQLKTGEIIPIGITYYETVRQTLSDYISHLHIVDSRIVSEREQL